MLLPNRNGSSDSYRYGFQGQEKDDEIKGEGNSINYKYRMHDPRVGRFFAVDPLTLQYPHYTPYSFSGNKPIRFLEREGLEESDTMLDYLIGAGKTFFTIETTDNLIDKTKEKLDALVTYFDDAEFVLKLKSNGNVGAGVGGKVGFIKAEVSLIDVELYEVTMDVTNLFNDDSVFEGDYIYKDSEIEFSSHVKLGASLLKGKAEVGGIAYSKFTVDFDHTSPYSGVGGLMDVKDDDADAGLYANLTLFEKKAKGHDLSTLNRRIGNEYANAEEQTFGTPTVKAESKLVRDSFTTEFGIGYKVLAGFGLSVEIGYTKPKVDGNNNNENSNESNTPNN